MMRFSLKRSAGQLVLFILCVGLAGCATTSNTTKAPVIEEIPFSSDAALSPYSSVSFKVENQTGKYDNDIELLEAAIAGQLRNNKVFERVYYSLSTKAQTDGLIVRLVVTSAHFIGEYRAAMGVMSGGAGITFYLEFIDGTTRSIIGRKVFESGVGGMEFAYTEHVIRKAAKQAVVYIEHAAYRTRPAQAR